MSDAAAIAITNASKLYRKYAHRRQFSTLKSALLKGSLTSELNPDEVFHAVNDVSLEVAKGSTLGVIGRNGSGTVSYTHLTLPTILLV